MKNFRQVKTVGGLVFMFLLIRSPNVMAKAYHYSAEKMDNMSDCILTGNVLSGIPGNPKHRTSLEGSEYLVKIKVLKNLKSKSDKCKGNTLEVIAEKTGDHIICPVCITPTTSSKTNTFYLKVVKDHLEPTVCTQWVE